MTKCSYCEEGYFCCMGFICPTDGELPCYYEPKPKSRRPNISDWFRDIYEETNRRLNEST